MNLPPIDASDEEIATWVRSAVAALDETPRNRYWRHRARGSLTVGDALDMGPPKSTLGLHVPVGEYRIVKSAAEERGMTPDPFLRRVMGTWLVAVEGVDADVIPWFLRDGMLGP